MQIIDPARMTCAACPGEGPGALLPIFFVTATLDDNLGVQHLLADLAGQRTTHVITLHGERFDFRDPYAMEAVASRVAAFITGVLPPGKPFLLSGFCTFALPALRAAYRLRHAGCRGVMMLDTPVPGHPYPRAQLSCLRNVAAYVRAIQAHRRLPQTSKPLHRHIVKQKLLLHALRVGRPLLRPVWRQGWLQALIAKAMRHEVKCICTLERLRLPVLHLWCDTQPYFAMQLAVPAWPGLTGAPLTEKILHGTHTQVLAARNRKRILTDLAEWEANLC